MTSPAPADELVGVSVVGDRIAVVGRDVATAGPAREMLAAIARIERARHPRWVWWSAAGDAKALVGSGHRLHRCWDVAEAHRLLAGGWEAAPARAWAAAHRLPVDDIPRAAGADLFDFAAGLDLVDLADSDSPVRSDGFLRPDAVDGSWISGPDRHLAWARAAVETAQLQAKALLDIGARALRTAHSESAAALLCVELERTGLPVDRPTVEALIAEAAGPRPRDARHAREIRRRRDQAVLRHTPGRESTDLRNPAQVRELLASVGVVVPDTRAHRLEPYRHTHSVVEALLTWRKAERIATTYGYHWLDQHVGADDRLRGGWTACDGAGGRMTAQNGLHNLPTPLRPAVAAAPGHLFVRADLGQIEPRVLAVVSGDRSFARATQADDLYAPVSAALGVPRPVAKVAVLAAMYGQTSGPAGEALKDLQRAYPVAMGFLDRAYDEGAAGRAVRTFGGRRVPMWESPTDVAQTASPDAVVAARGRFARNAVIQGAAAELFKAWAATVRLTTAHLGAQIVLCLHDELLVHAPADRADEVAAAVEAALVASARRWSGTDAVRFVADTSVIRRWSDAKGRGGGAVPGGR